MVAAVVSLIVGVIKDGTEGLIEPLSIVAALIIITVVNSANSYTSEIKLRDLLMINGFYRPVAVYRGGPFPKTIHEGKLVVGDIYQVSNGMSVPADSILIEALGIQCDESSLTGEAESVSKIIGSTMLSKTDVLTGQGKAIVVAVGTNTVAGWIQENTEKVSEPTLL